MTRWWYPNGRQWWAIWLAVVPALLLWISSDSSRETEHLAVSIAIMGALIAWRLSSPADLRRDQEAKGPTIANISHQLEMLQETLEQFRNEIQERDFGTLEAQTREIGQELSDIRSHLVEIRDILQDARTDARVARHVSSKPGEK